MADDTVPIIDPQTQAILDRWRQQQILQQSQSQNQEIGNPTTLSGGINALGIGLGNAIRQYKTQQLEQSLAAQLGGGAIPLTPLISGGGTGGFNMSPELPAALRSTPPSGLNDVSMGGGDFAAKIAPVAQNASALTGIDPRIVAAQAALESNYGKAAPGNNFFGIKGPGQTLATHESVGGQMVPQNASFRTFASPEDAGAGYAKLMGGDRYAPVRNAQGLDAQLNALQHSGYATDPNYSSKLRQIINKNFGGLAPQAQNAPSSYGVPAGQVAGPGVPTNLPPPIEPTTPEGRAAAIGAAGPMPPPRPTQSQSPVAIAPQPMSPSAANPALSPNLMGPASGFSLSPGAGGPGAAVASPPPAAPPPAPQPTPLPPQAPPRPVAAPSVAVPQGTGSAYDPRTGRFLAPGEQIPGYAPAPMSSTGGPGDIGNLLSRLFGGGTAQPAPTQPSPMARALGGGAPAQAAASIPPAAQQPGPLSSTPGAQAVQGVQGGSPSAAPIGNSLNDQLKQAYNFHDRQFTQLQQKANALMGTPFQANVQAQANSEKEERDKAQQQIISMETQQQNRQVQHITDPATGDIHSFDPYTNKDLGTVFKGGEGTRALTSAEEQAHHIPAGTPAEIDDKGKVTILKVPGSEEGAKAGLTPHKVVDPTTGQEVSVTIDKDGAVHRIELPPPPGQQASAPGQAPRAAPLAPEDQGESAPPNPRDPGAVPLSQAEEAKLAQQPAEWQSNIRAILQDKQTMPQPKGERGLKPSVIAFQNAVRAVRPDFDATQNANAVDIRKKYSPGGSNTTPGMLIVNGDSAIDHTATMMDRSDEAENLGSVLGGAAGMASRVLPPGMQPQALTDFAQKKAALDQAATVAAGETVKYLSGAQGGGQLERAEEKAAFDTSSPPQARQAAARVLVQDMLEKKLELKAGWNRAMPNAGDFQVISPRAAENAKRLGFADWFDKNNNLVGPGAGGGVPPGGAPTGGPAGQTAPATQAAPPETLTHQILRQMPLNSTFGQGSPYVPLAAAGALTAPAWAPAAGAAAATAGRAAVPPLVRGLAGTVKYGATYDLLRHLLGG